MTAFSKLRTSTRALPMTGCTAIVLGTAEVVYARLPDAGRGRLIAWASTNVHRLGDEPLGPLLASVVVVVEDPLLWYALAVFCVASAEVRIGWRAALLIGGSAHLVGTAVSEGIVWWRYHHGRLPPSALFQPDVGVSYLVVGLLTATVMFGSRATRLIAIVCLLALSPALLSGLGGLDVGAVGHLTAMVTAVAAGLGLRRIRQVRCART